MKIETKFNVGDQLFRMYSNAVQEVKVVAVKTFTRLMRENARDPLKEYTTIEYSVEFYDVRREPVTDNVSEEKLFGTKQDLLNSL